MADMPTESAGFSPEVPETTSPVEPTAPGTSAIYQEGRPLRRYVLWLTLSLVALGASLAAIAAILLPNQVQELEFARYFTGANAHVDLTTLENLKNAVAGGKVATPEEQSLLHLLGQFDADRAQALALVSSVATFVTLLIQPIVGTLSDRTRSRLGRRAPWLLSGGIVSVLFLIGMRFAPTVAVLVVFVTITQGSINLALGPLQTTIADRTPKTRLATVSAMSGLGVAFGAIGGVIAASLLFARLGLNTYFFFALPVLIGIVGFVLLARDQSSKALAVSSFHWGSFLRGFLIPLLDRDFRWVWIARVVLTFGSGTSSALTFYMLQSYISPALSASAATQMASLLVLAGLPATIAGMAISGQLSDKVGRRKPFVIAASLLMAVAFFVPFVWPTLIALFIQIILTGLATGIYATVDQALFIDVLPDKTAAGRDLGIAAMANSIGQALGPLLAAEIVTLTGGYRMIWVVGLVLVLVAAVVIVPVKRAR
jgi:MFS family permease